MNIIDASTPKPKVLGILDTEQNVVYRGEQSGKFYIGLRVNKTSSKYLAELNSGLLCWNGTCNSDTTFVAVEADLVIKN